MKTGAISVVVPTFRRLNDLTRCLEALSTQTLTPNEVIVVVRSEDQTTIDFLKSTPFQNLKVQSVEVSLPGVVAAMTAGIRAASEPIIALTDDDAAPRSDWLELINNVFLTRPDVVGVGGRDYQATGALEHERSVVGILQWHGRVVGNHHLGVGPAREVDILKGVNCAYRATPLKELGFDSRLRGIGAQVHWELSLGLGLRQLGWKLIYDPAIAVDHYISQRHDKDQTHRGGFSEESISHMVYNETLVLCSYLSPLRRIAFLCWSVLVGTRMTPGFVQYLRLVVSRQSSTLPRFRATIRGRLQGAKKPSVNRI